ncbi:MAG: zinc ribbon domain-containing protein [Calditrichaeota bacterium]|nr:zinc ribbon domain-containing protein [Calditrichota bacterium]MCB9391484.1 zinc ribbon domain-containing protein [Calditrichota bacterium]
MPTYEYVCENRHEFEEFQSMLDPALEVCPICGARAERRISAGSGLIFKGSGFYITDYARKSSSGGTSSEKKSESSSGSSSGSGSTDGNK